MNDIHTCSYYCDKPECIKQQRDQLRENVEDSELLDFLADANQTVANVQLPTHIILSNVSDMRDAIRETKRQWEAGELSPNA